jgi:hypothetical protein
MVWPGDFPGAARVTLPGTTVAIARHDTRRAPETNREDPLLPVINHVGIEAFRRVLLRNLKRPSRSEGWRLRFLSVSPVQLRRESLGRTKPGAQWDSRR